MSLEIVNILTKLSKTDMNNSINHIIKNMDSNITDTDISKICNIMKSNMGMINDAIENKNNLNFDSSGFMQYIKKLDCSNQSGGSNKKTKKYNYYIIIQIIIIIFGIVVMIIKGISSNNNSSSSRQIYGAAAARQGITRHLDGVSPYNTDYEMSFDDPVEIEGRNAGGAGSSPPSPSPSRLLLFSEVEDEDESPMVALDLPTAAYKNSTRGGLRPLSDLVGGGLDTNKISTIITVIIAKYFSQQKTTINTIESIPITFEISKIGVEKPNDIYTILYMINLYGLNSFQNIII